jgi:nickel/cobalt exporter
MEGFVRVLTPLFYLFAPALAFAQISDGHDSVRQQLEGLLSVKDPSAGFIAVALGVAFLAGAAHALTPGHGKAVVAAYLAGSRGTVGDAFYLGTVVTITHTATVFLLGLVTLLASHYFLMEQVYTWLSLGSGILIVTIGLWLLSERLRAMRSGGGDEGEHGHSHWPWGGHHHHDHGHTHSHSHEQDHVHEHGHSHDHDHTHDHDNHAHDHRHDGHTHSHEGHTHSHAPAALKTGIPKTGRGSLLTLGISGGLVPCPEAMAVLLISFTINRLAFGLIILAAFSLGLAAVLIAIGVAMVMAGPALTRFSKDGPLMRILPVGSALVVTLLGVAIVFKTASDSGMLRF